MWQKVAHFVNKIIFSEIQPAPYAAKKPRHDERLCDKRKDCVVSEQKNLCDNYK